MEKIKNKQKGTKTVLRRVLEQDGRKLKWLADASGINYQRLQRIANHGYEPTITEAAKIANALKKSLVTLFPSDELQQALAATMADDVMRGRE
jgi:transcriptional regulator with XRE-family HTH domain